MILSEKLKKTYEQNGFCIIKKLFTDTEIKNLNNRIRLFIKNESKKLKGKDINRTLKNKVNTMHDIDKHDLYFKKFSQKKKNNECCKIFLRIRTRF